MHIASAYGRHRVLIKLFQHVLVTLIAVVELQIFGLRLRMRGKCWQGIYILLDFNNCLTPPVLRLPECLLGIGFFQQVCGMDGANIYSAQCPFRT
jgi:hypothetical protein